MVAGVCQQVGHAASRQGGAPHGRERTQVRPVSQDISFVAAAGSALARTHQRAQVRLCLLRQGVQATLARPATPANPHRSAPVLFKSTLTVTEKAK